MANGAVLDGPVPGQEMTQVVAIAAQGRRREVVTRQAGEEGDHPARFGGRSPRLLVLHAKSSPALAPRFVACNTPVQIPISRPMRLHAMIARNKQAVRTQIGMEFLLLNSNRRNSVGVLVSYRTFSHDCPFRP